MAREQSPALRRGWTTGACAAAASRAAFTAMMGGRFPDPVAIRLPRGGTAAFPLALAELTDTGARGQLGAEPATFEAARAATGAAEILGIAGDLREGLARAIAGRAREVALATICGKTAVEIAIVNRQDGFLARVGG